MKKQYITPEFRPRKMAVEESLLAAISENGKKKINKKNNINKKTKQKKNTKN